MKAVDLKTINLAQISIPNYGPGSFTALFSGILTAVTGIIGSLAGIMIIIAGILYLTSAGNPQKIQTAKTALIYAVIGIIIALAAGSIVAFIQSTVGS